MHARLILTIFIAFSIGTLAAVLLRSGYIVSSISTGKPLVGGHFELTDQHGKTVTDQDFRGKYMLVEFGYTYCPDVCPTELNVISSALEKLGEKANTIVPIFITVDPERDTVEQMATYISSFHPSMVGLTGTKEQIKEAASAYRVYYAKAADGGSDDSYLMDHSTFIYLMNPQGEYLTHFGYGISADELAERLSAALTGAGA